MKTLIKIFAVAALAAGLTAGVARAVPTLYLTADAGATWLTVADQGVGDVSALLGTVNWSGAIGGFTLSVDVGQSKPTIGSATSPNMDLDFVATGVGTLNIFFVDTGFTATGSVMDAIGGTIGVAGNSVSDYVFKNWTTAGGLTPITAQVLTAPSNTWGFTATTYGSVSLLPGDNLTLAVVVNNATVGTTTGDKNVVVPDGGTTALLLGLGLLGMGLIRRSKKS